MDDRESASLADDDVSNLNAHDVDEESRLASDFQFLSRKVSPFLQMKGRSQTKLHERALALSNTLFIRILKIASQGRIDPADRFKQKTETFPFDIIWSQLQQTQSRRMCKFLVRSEKFSFGS